MSNGFYGNIMYIPKDGQIREVNCDTACEDNIATITTEVVYEAADKSERPAKKVERSGSFLLKSDSLVISKPNTEDQSVALDLKWNDLDEKNDNSVVRFIDTGKNFPSNIADLNNSDTVSTFPFQEGTIYFSVDKTYPGNNIGTIYYDFYDEDNDKQTRLVMSSGEGGAVGTGGSAISTSNGTDALYSNYTESAIYSAGGIAAKSQIAAKTIRIDDGDEAGGKGCVLSYDGDTETLTFTFKDGFTS